MSKRPNQTSQIIRKANKLCKGNEHKVFTDWFLDNKDFNPANSLVSERTNIDRTNVARVFKSLLDKNILVISGFKKVPGKKSITIYDLHPNMLKKEAKNDVEQPLVTTDLTKTKIQEELDPEIEKLLAGYGA